MAGLGDIGLGTVGVRQAPGNDLLTGVGAARQLAPAEQRQVARLRQRDREVRQHEQAHLAAAGPYARGRANFSYTVGPDGKRYATGGEVEIDVSPAATPEATVRKMRAVKRAAVAPGNPSPQDRAVYAEAARLEVEAQREATQQRPGFDPLRPEALGRDAALVQGTGPGLPGIIQEAFRPSAEAVAQLYRGLVAGAMPSVGAAVDVAV